MALNISSWRNVICFRSFDRDILSRFSLFYIGHSPPYQLELESYVLTTNGRQVRPLADDVVIGVDLGTSGIRAIAATFDGRVVGIAARALGSAWRSGPIHEQDPVEWGRLLEEVLSQLTSAVAGVPIAGIGLTSTSGTLVPVDDSGDPVRAAIMYDDTRAAPQAEKLNGLSGGEWNASHSLAKALWLRDQEPAVWSQVRRLLHPADWLLGKLSHSFATSDYSNALKLGYNPEASDWCPAVAHSGIDASLLPCVKAPGEIVGQAADHIPGLPARTPLIAGGTDGLASMVASGASRPGDLNTTIGTTIVWKALSRTRPPQSGGIYSHKHPTRLWAPGAASSAGAGSLEFGDADPEEWNRAAEKYLPTKVLSYPLRGTGERFPFCAPDATTFVEGSPRSAEELHAARLQGIAFVERWGYECMEAAGVETLDRVYSAGTACASDVLNRLRASVMGRCVFRAREPNAAMGAAILAAAAVWFRSSVAGAIRQMVSIADRQEPESARRDQYEELYAAFRESCRSRGWDS
jgi:xylulokinase